MRFAAEPDVPDSIAARLDMLEDTLRRLSDLPQRVDTLSTRVDRVELAIRELEASLRVEIEETRRFMRILHEDLVGRIAVLGDRLAH